MAADTQHKLGDEEPKIPVFTVLKNGAILKNIFIVNNSNHHHLLNRPTPSEFDQILIVGRHPDCNIMLTHPSISRFHLQILSNPSSQKLSVIDLSSVHGTWVSDKKIDPLDRVELREGDSLRIGGSSRVYRLHWIPLSQAYDFESPYASASDAPLAEEKEEEVSMEAYQDENSLTIGNEHFEEEEKMVTMEMNTHEEELEDNNYVFMENREIPSLDLVVEGMSSLFSEESLGITVKKEIPSAPPMPENPIYSLFDDDDEFIESSLKDVDEQREISRRHDGPFGAESGQFSLPFEPAESGKDKKLEPSIGTEFVCEEKSDLAALVLEENEKQSLFIEVCGQTDESPLLVRKFAGKTENQHDDIKDLDREALHALVSPSHKGNQENSKPCCDEVPSASERLEENEDLSLSRGHHKQKDVSIDYYMPCMTESMNSLFLAEEIIQEVLGNEENLTPQSLRTVQSETQRNSPISPEKKTEFRSIWSRRGKPANIIQLRIGRSREEAVAEGVYPEYDRHNQENMEDKPISDEVFSCLNGEEEEILTRDKENLTSNTTLQAKSLRKKGKLSSVGQPQTGTSRVEPMLASADSEAEQHNQDTIEDKSFRKETLSCFDGEEEEIYTPDKENFTPNTLLVKSSKKKGKLASVGKLQTSKSRFESMLACADSQGAQYNQERTGEKSISRELFSSLNGEEEEVFTPNKENFTPNTLLHKSLKKKGILEEVKHSRGCGSSSPRLTFSPDVHPEKDSIASSNKENQTLRVLQEVKPAKQTVSGNQVRPERELMANKRRQERVPFQSLVVNDRTRSDTLVPISATKSCSSVNYTQNVERSTNPRPRNSIKVVKRSWTMVVDATTLLNKESRKSLQLLQGLKGTCLVIPRMVIRELHCLKRRGSLFRRKTEACLVLEWIEQCMVEKSWWIHVQSSAEDGRLTAPTPPASPRSPFSQGSGGFFHGASSSLPFLSHWNFMDIVSPTTEDHILECSLLCRKMTSDGHLVLLSDDVTLKIKAMAEGLICETAAVFRESLMNPFSERFLWVDSSPRGQTWSIMDDVFLREKYNRFPLKKPLKGESAKGLKLILLHNSHYGQRTLLG